MAPLRRPDRADRQRERNTLLHDLLAPGEPAGLPGRRWSATWRCAALAGLFALAGVVCWLGWPAAGISSGNRALLLALVAAAALAESLTLDFPDRKNLSVGYVFPFVVAATVGPGLGVACAGVAGGIAALARARPGALRNLPIRLLRAPRLLLAAAAGLLALRLAWGGPALSLSLTGAEKALLYAATYSLTSWGLARGQAWLAPSAGEDPAPELLTNLLLAPLPLALATIFARAGQLGLTISALALALLLIVVRTYVNLSTLHRELKMAYERLSKQEEDLEQALDTNRELTQIVSHDLRGPLTSIMGYADLLRGVLEPASTGAKEQRYLDALSNNARRMLSLTDRLLDLHRVEQQSGPQLTAVDAAGVVRELVEMLRVQVDAKPISLQVDIPPHAQLRSSDWMLREIAENLLTNAIKYTPSGGQVRVRLERQPDQVLFSVEDTGIGIPPADQARLFSKFFRGTSREVRQAQGTGLGLALTRSMAERLGGHIEVWSEEGRGSRFTVHLPAEEEPCAS
ncbi:MAG TPA: HAMP domain-containing sensor histidine kinase [Chloroflexota bacterium]|nr:HAMP domain-containing sensor histidine kinase [Chloroflexota bacterium]